MQKYAIKMQKNEKLLDKNAKICEIRYLCSKYAFLDKICKNMQLQIDAILLQIT